MMRWGVVIFILSVASSQPDEECTEPSRIIFKSPGNLTITGIFDAHEGELCNQPLGKGLEEAAAAVWTVSVLNQQNYLPGIDIGLNLYDGCNDPEDVRRTLVQEMVFENCAMQDSPTLATLVSANIKMSLDPLTSGLNKTLMPVSEVLPFSSLSKMMVALLREMNINTIHRLIGENSNVLKNSGQLLAREGICVYDQVVVEDYNGVNNEVLQPPKTVNDSLVVDGPPVLLVIASSNRITNMLKSLTPTLHNMTDVEWFLLPIDSAIKIESGTIIVIFGVGVGVSRDFFPKNAYILSAVMPDIKDLQSFLEQDAMSPDPLNHKTPSRSPFFLNIASAILKILAPLKIISTQCAGLNDTCSSMTSYLENRKNNKSNKAEESRLSKEKIIDILTTLKVAPDSEMFLFTVTETAMNEEIAVFQNYNPENSIYSPTLLFMQGERRKRSIARIRIDDIIRRQKGNSSETTTRASKTHFIRHSTEKHPCYEPDGNMPRNCGICLNFVKFLTKAGNEVEGKTEGIKIGWRFEAWVGINTSIASIGILCSLAVILFISIRMCAGDVLEGNPLLSFLLLFAIILTYCSTLPFSFEASGLNGDLKWASILCDLRVAAPPVSYAILFSIIFSRSVMLAACDQDGGFMSHVNGYIQGVVIFFVFSVQLVYSGEYWFFNTFLFNPSISCEPMYEEHRFIILLGYNLLLLVLSLAVTPFMCRSKRNYFEGAFFTIAIFILLLIWSSWITLFYILPPSLSDAIVVFGLTSTATAILVCVFIPRTYMMTTSIVRDRIVNTLPPLPHSEINFRSNQALYDSINISGKAGNANSNFYSLNPADSVPATPQIQPGHYYSSDSGLKVPTPKKANLQGNPKPRIQTPQENTYDGYDSPLHNPVNVTRF